MRRRLLNLATVVSLLLCVAAVVLWVRSHWGQDVLRKEAYSPDGTSKASFTLVNSRGIIVLSTGREVYSHIDGTGTIDVTRFFSAVPVDQGWEYESYSFAPLQMRVATPEPKFPWEHLGFIWRAGNTSWRTPRWTTTSTWREVALPWWLLVAASLIVPAFRLRSLIVHRRRTGQRLCPSCGYDLRGTPGRCPECGAEPLKTPA